MTSIHRARPPVTPAIQGSERSVGRNSNEARPPGPPAPEDGFASAATVSPHRVTQLEAPPGADGLRRYVELDEAKALFDEVANAKDIPHHFIDDGCHFRAHLVAYRLEQAGVYSEKLFMVPQGGVDLRISSDKHPLGFTLGMFHNAACISVKLPNGAIERRVLDPSLFAGPVPVETWASRMRGLNNRPCELLYLPRFASHLLDRRDPPMQWRQRDLDDAIRWNTDYLEVQQSMNETDFYAELVQMAEEQSAGTFSAT